jgi:dCMP deaminase
MRPTWTQYFLDLAKLAATRATCPVRQVGAILVDPATNTVLATGYNGAPRGTAHCGEACYNRVHGQRTNECRAVHAEMNAILSAARVGTRLEGAHLYCTMAPCVPCARALIQVGVRRVEYLNPSAYPEAVQELKEAGIEIE